MITQGKHAKIKLYEQEVRIFKTYKNPVYAENEYFSLNFLAKEDIMDLVPKKESLNTISMKWIKNCKSPDLSSDETCEFLAKKLADYLKKLHMISFQRYNKYITHEDLFEDNILICPKTETIYFIDWGLSQKRDDIYPDIASPAIGVFNEKPYFYTLFLKNYFKNNEEINFEKIKLHIKIAHQNYYQIRTKNNIETLSLDERLEKAMTTICTTEKMLACT